VKIHRCELSISSPCASNDVNVDKGLVLMTITSLIYSGYKRLEDKSILCCLLLRILRRGSQASMLERVIPVFSHLERRCHLGMTAK
jgi:hypothetical protein